MTNQPFRGERLPRAHQMLESKRIRTRYHARTRNKTYSMGFGFMLRNMPVGERYRLWDTTPGEYWMISREGWPARTFMRRPKRTNTAIDRILATELPF